METWLNELYSEGADTDLGKYTLWLIDTLGSFGGLTLVFILGLATMLFVIYVKMSRSFTQGLILTILVTVLGFFAYYFMIFKEDYPMNLMLDSIDSSSSYSLLEEKEIERLDVQSVAVSPLDEELERSEIAIIGAVDYDKLKKLMFTIRNKENKLETYTLYGYVSEEPSKERKDYITYYKINKKELLTEMQVLPFFQHDMYNITVYKRVNNLENPNGKANATLNPEITPKAETKEDVKDDSTK